MAKKRYIEFDLKIGTIGFERGSKKISVALRSDGFRRFRLEIDSVTVIPLAIAFFLLDTIAVTYDSQM